MLNFYNKTIEEDYLDLIVNNVTSPYLKMDEKSIYDAINRNKSNERLYFLAFKDINACIASR